MPTVIPFAEAESDFEKLLNSVVIRDSVAIIARQDAPDAVVMSLDTYNSIMETAYLLKSPANAQRLARSIRQHRAGDAVEQTLIDD
jgi:antitoxin YefM